MDLIAKAKGRVLQLTAKMGSSKPAPPAEQVPPRGRARSAGSPDVSDMVAVSAPVSPNASRFAELRRMLREEELLDVEALRKVAWFGCPDDCRAAVWKLLLEYWPSTRESRDMIEARKRAEYQHTVLRNYSNRDWDALLDTSKGGGAVGRDAVAGTDEIATVRQIRKDVPRTANAVAAVSHPRAQAMLERLLFVWAVRHPASGYVQGMNDLALPFFYTLLADHLAVDAPTDSSPTDELCDGLSQSIRRLLSMPMDEVEQLYERLGETRLLELEADTYWLTSCFISMVQDNFTYNQTGAHAMVHKLERVLSTTDPALTMHLDELGIKFPEFAFRWMNCFLLRELSATQAVRLFDTYLCERNEFAELHIYICAAMLRKWSATITESPDFVFVMHFLHAPPTRDMDARAMDELCSSAYLLQQLYRPNLGGLKQGDSQQVPAHRTGGASSATDGPP